MKLGPDLWQLPKVSSAFNMNGLGEGNQIVHFTRSTHARLAQFIWWLQTDARLGCGLMESNYTPRKTNPKKCNIVKNHFFFALPEFLPLFAPPPSTLANFFWSTSSFSWICSPSDFLSLEISSFNWDVISFRNSFWAGVSSVTIHYK